MFLWFVHCTEPLLCDRLHVNGCDKEAARCSGTDASDHASRLHIQDKHSGASAIRVEFLTSPTNFHLVVLFASSRRRDDYVCCMLMSIKEEYERVNGILLELDLFMVDADFATTKCCDMSVPCCKIYDVLLPCHHECK